MKCWRKVSAINSKTIKVTFDNGETTEVTLEKALVAGENEVTFTYNGQEFTTTITFEAPVATSIEISTNRVQDAASQSIAYTVKDQYGEEFEVDPADLTVSVYNVTDKQNFGTVSDLTNVDIDSMAGVDAGDVLRLLCRRFESWNLKVPYRCPAQLLWF